MPSLLNRIRFAITGRSALWAAARPVPRISDWGMPSPGFYSNDSPESLRRRAEDAFRNSPVARRAITFLCDSVVGSVGLSPQFSSPQTQGLWSQWCDGADYDGRCDWTGLLYLALQTMCVSGEAFILPVIDPERRPVPFSLRLLSPDFLDTSRTDEDTRNGIAYNADGRRRGYWFYRVHPALQTAHTSFFVPVEDCIHLYRQLAAGQQRGISWLAPVLISLKELDEFLTASLTKQKVSALYCGSISSPENVNPLGGDPGVPDLAPGSMARLRPGESIDWSDPPDCNDFDPFVRVMLRRIASGLNIPYAALSGDHSQITFASGRHARLDVQQHIEGIQFDLLVPQFCLPVMRRWLELARSLDLVPDSGEQDPRWVGPSLPLLDPQREIAGLRDAIRAGLISRSEAVRRSGWSSETVDAENSRDNERADRLGLVYDSDARRVSAQGQAQQVSQEVNE